MSTVDFNQVGWIRLTLWQRIRILYARYTVDYINVRATDGTKVQACADFAEVNWKCPGLHQERIDEQAANEKKYRFR